MEKVEFIPEHKLGSVAHNQIEENLEYYSEKHFLWVMRETEGLRGLRET